MKTCKEKALEWNVSPRSVNDMCKKGRIQGAIKEKGSWLIPDDSPKPMDGRVSSGKYIKKNMVAKAEVKSLPIGISDYVRAQEEYYYVDKTLLIKEFLDQKPLVSLFTRPRRFGKTLNMDMLRVFFEISDKNTSKYFADKNIWQCGEEYRSHQGKYPVIFLTFKDVKFDTWDATIDKIRGLLQEEYGRHQELLNSDKLSQYEKEYFTKIISATANEVELTSSLERLSKMLASHYDKAPVIIIDEYDTPIQEGYSKEFYDEIIGFMRNFFSGAFKDNKNLSYGFLTGILRIAQESIFSGLNNLTVNSVMDEEYDSFFGFTESEVKAMLSYYGVSDKEEELKDWYDGYLFGSEEIYNPWSVINYISKGCLPQAYWVNTGKNEILDDVLRVATDDITERLYDLLQGERVVARIDQNVLTLWYKFIITKECKGDNFLIVYADDFVAGFQYKWEAENYYKLLKERMEKFGLQLEDSKSRLLQSGAYIARAKQKSGECIRLQTFDFLGFTFYCGRSRKGMPYIMPKTSSKKFRQKIRDIKVWLYANRDQPLKKLMGMLNLKLIGHYRYYGISFNGRMISNYKQQVRELLFKVLNRRSDRKSYTREGFIEMLKYYPLAMPKIYVSLF